MLNLDPAARPTIAEALEHPWVATYHEEADEPEAPKEFAKWHEIEKLETIDQFRQAIWDEIHDYRREVRSIGVRKAAKAAAEAAAQPVPPATQSVPTSATTDSMGSDIPMEQTVATPAEAASPMQVDEPESTLDADTVAPLPEEDTGPAPASDGSEVDPIRNYARRSSLMQPQQHVAFPTASGEQEEYIVPTRSRAGSTVEGGGRLLRTLSTVSVKDKTAVALGSNVRFGMTKDEEKSADAPPTEFPIEFQTKASKARAERAKEAAAIAAREAAESGLSSGTATAIEQQPPMTAVAEDEVEVRLKIEGLPEDASKESCGVS